MSAGSDELRVDVIGVFEQRSREPDGDVAATPLCVLRDSAQREITLSIGSCEALAIQLALGNHVVARPLSHDLALRLIEKLAASLDRVLIERLAGDVCEATIHLRTQHEEVVLRAQPGDAIALALRAEAPIYVTEDVMAGSDRERDELF